MMVNKKGLSDVVTTVLIVLLTIVAIAMLWSYLSPLITGTGTRINLAQSCLSANLEIVQCSAADGSATIKRNPGQGTANVGRIKLIYEKPDGSTVVNETSNVPAELGTVNYPNMAGFIPKSVGVAAGIVDSQGAVTYCNALPQVNCR